MTKRALRVLPMLMLVASCQTDRAPAGVTEPSSSSELGQLRSASVAATTLCDPCTYGPATLLRDRGGPLTDTTRFTAAAGSTYIVDIDDLASQGADGSVALNGVSLMAPRAADEVGPRHVNTMVSLASANTLVVRLLGKPGSQLRIAIWRFPALTLDEVSLTTGRIMQLGGPALQFIAIITNHHTAAVSDVAIEAWLTQPSARRSAGGAPVSCIGTGAASGVVPPGLCIRMGNGITASNAGSGFGTLVPGTATAVIRLLRLGQVIDSLIVPGLRLVTSLSATTVAP